MKRKWANVYPGDFVHLSCNEIIPADILLLRSSDSAGICHIETSNIDGENNLKQRQIVTGITRVVSFHLLLQDGQFSFLCFFLSCSYFHALTPPPQSSSKKKIHVKNRAENTDKWFLFGSV